MPLSGTLFSRFPHGYFLPVSLISVLLSLFLESFNLLSVVPLDNLSSRYLSLFQVVCCPFSSTRMKALKAGILFVLFTAVPLMLSTWKVISISIVEWMNVCLICAYFFLPGWWAHLFLLIFLLSLCSFLLLLFVFFRTGWNVLRCISEHLPTLVFWSLIKQVKWGWYLLPVHYKYEPKTPDPLPWKPVESHSIPSSYFVEIWFFSSDGKESAYSAGNLCSITGLGRSLGEGNGNPLQYSCLEDPMDRGAWQTTVQRVLQSQTWLSD